MIKDTDIVIQGPIFKETFDLAACYASLDFVNRVVVSTWNDQNYPPKLPAGVNMITSSYPENGTGNMNLQIVSSLAGIKLCTAPTVVKMRSDQIVSRSSMYMLNDFYKAQKQTLAYSNGNLPESPVCVIGMNKIYPFHPQDHIFWGHGRCLHRIFDITLMTNTMRRVGNNFKEELRCVIYLGAMYFGWFDPVVFDFLRDYKTYLVDEAPKWKEAQEVSEKIRDQVFKVFPRFDMHWVKYNSPYWYGSYEQQGEYYAN